MNILPSAVAAAVARALGVRVEDARPLRGGMVCSAARVVTSSGPVFVKWKDRAPDRFFECEADGLARLRQTGAVSVPDVLGWCDGGDAGSPSWLALQWVDDDGRLDVGAATALGAALAAMHRSTASVGGTYGLPVQNYLGSKPQDNTPTTSWVEFYRDRRIRPQVEQARRNGRLGPDRERLLDAAIARTDDVLGPSPGPACLVHGDLWAGNVLATGGRPVLIDPAVYHADREVEIAYMELFSGFEGAALDAYRSTWPLDAGYAYRKPMLQLYPLLVHLNHFGETYAPQVEAVCRRYTDEPGRGTRRVKAP